MKVTINVSESTLNFFLQYKKQDETIEELLSKSLDVLKSILLASNPQ